MSDSIRYVMTERIPGMPPQRAMFRTPEEAQQTAQELGDAPGNENRSYEVARFDRETKEFTPIWHLGALQPIRVY